MPHPMRCVNEIFRLRDASAALKPWRRVASVATATSRNDVAVGTPRESVMFCTSRAAGPVIAVIPWAGIAPGAAAGAAVGAADASTSARSVLMMGSSASFPLSNRARQSSETEAGSRRYCSYITCTKAALLVPKTNSLTCGNLNTPSALSYQPSAPAFIETLHLLRRCGHTGLTRFEEGPLLATCSHSGIFQRDVPKRAPAI